VKSLINDLKTDFEERFKNLEVLITQNAKTESVADKELNINEAVDRATRKSNIIISNVKEEGADLDTVTNILKVIDPAISVCEENIHRLGKQGSNPSRLLKVRLSNPDVANKVLRSRFLLKQSDYKNVKINNDMTRQQIVYLKNVRKNLEERTQSGEENLTIKYINGLPQIVDKSAKN
jgi:hypothetical protein